jgi:hypothetical protein
VNQKVTIPQKLIENTQFCTKRTSDLGHYSLWPQECDSTGELVIQRTNDKLKKPQVLKTETRKI